jgi:adenylosuccinate synthase
MPPPAWIILGLGYGDEGKGALVDALTRRTGIRVNVRFNGGPQAAHHVVAPDGRQHCFSQFGAGTLTSGVETFLSHYCFIDPLALNLEQQALARIGVRDAARRLCLDPACPLLTPWHGLLNRIQERVRGNAAHGTCGRGIGALFADLAAHPEAIPRAADLSQPRRLVRRLGQTRERLIALAEPLVASCPDDPLIRQWFDDLITPELPAFVVEQFTGWMNTAGPTLADTDWLRTRAGTGLILEGAQGALLDMDQGDWPHVTPSRTTAANALELLDEIGFGGQRIRLGVTRAYATRHGPGPLVSEVPGLASQLPEIHNRDDGWQGRMRVGWLDLVALRRAIASNQGLDGLAITCLDRLAACSSAGLCDGYHSTLPHWGELEAGLSRDNAGIIRAIAAPPGTLSLAQRERFTARLSGCQPQVRPLTTDAADLARIIGRHTGVPIACLSYGPTAREKTWRPPAPGTASPDTS